MPVIESRLDHLVIVTAVLEEGIDFCEKTFGVKMVKGGEHVRVGTHNYLLALDGGIYLEVIAINPDAGPLSCPRWFGMDIPEQRKHAEEGPFLATFVARTKDIVQAVEALPELGPVRDMQRGTLEWQITIPDDGGLVEGGTVPTVIQWPEGIHPTRKLPPSGCRLERLEIGHPEPLRLREMWSRIGLREDDGLSIQETSNGGRPFLAARIATPNGIVTLR
jgi:hypothetical protein